MNTKPTKINRHLLKLACALLPLAMTGCLSLSELENEMSAAAPAATAPTPSLPASKAPASAAVGTWVGTVVYQVNGDPVPFYIIVCIPPLRDRITFTLNGSNAETTAARWSGNTVSWSSPGPSSMSQFTLIPIDGHTARVNASTAMFERGITLRGSGAFTKQ